MERRKRAAIKQETIIIDKDAERMEPLNKLLKLDCDKFTTLQSDVRTKGQVLTQSWSALFDLMSTYQAELISRQDELTDIESQIAEHRSSSSDPVTELENMQLQLLAKDKEIKTYHTQLERTQKELGKIKADVYSKDLLIQELQHQVQRGNSSGLSGDRSVEAFTAISSSEPEIQTISIQFDDEQSTEDVQIIKPSSNEAGSKDKEQLTKSFPTEVDGSRIQLLDIRSLTGVMAGTSGNDDTGQSFSTDGKSAQKRGRNGHNTGKTEVKSSLSQEMKDDVKPLLSLPKRGITKAQKDPVKQAPHDDIEIKPLMGLMFSRAEEVNPMRRSSPDIGQSEVRPLMQNLPIRPGSRPVLKRPRRERGFPCEICGQLSYDFATHTQHMRIHSGDEPYSCMRCGRIFPDPTSRRYHEQNCGASKSNFFI